MLHAPHAGTRSRSAVSALPSAELSIWRHYSRRFRETYGSRVIWDGERAAWPTKGNPFATGRAPFDGTLLPDGNENSAALARLIVLSKDDPTEVCARIDRAFEVPAIVELGVSLFLVANWWDHLRSTKAASERARLLTGRRA